MIAEFFIINEMPLTARVLMAPTVALSWEINPLGMAVFVAHKVEISAVDGRSRDQTNHFVQSNTANGALILVALAEMPIHIGINETENDSFVANQGLVVTFGV